MTNLEEINLIKSLNKILSGKKSEKEIKSYVQSISKFDTRYAFTRLIVDIFSVFYPNLQLFYSKIAEIESVSINGVSKTGKEMATAFKTWIGEKQTDHLSIEEDQKLVNKTLVWILNKFNENNIDYYLAGSLCFYLQANLQSFRYHDDIDFLVNENDICKLADIFKNSDFIFKDNRKNSGKRINPYGFPGGEHEIIAKNKYNEFHIGIFCFRRKEDGTVIHREYLKVPNKDNKLELKVFERQITKTKSDLSYDDSWHYLSDGTTKYKVGTIESIYQIKVAGEIEPNREKDAIDVAVMNCSNLVDHKKYQQLQEESSKCHNEIIDPEDKYFK